MAMFMMAMANQQRFNEHPLSRGLGSGAPIYGGTPVFMNQMFDGVPGLSGGPMGMLAGQLLQGMLPAFMAPSLIPGQYTPNQNLASHKLNARNFMQQRRAMELAAQSDEDTYYRLVRGAMRMTGTDPAADRVLDDRAHRDAGTIASIGSVIGPMFPELFDELHGVRGSAQMMARNIFEGGRYRFDPATGRLGMSGDAAGQMTNEIYKSLYGPGADLSRMRGIGAGQAGKMFDELTRRGFGPSATLDDAETQDDLARELSKSRSSIRSPELRALRDRLGVKDGDKDAMGKLQKGLDNLDQGSFDMAAQSFDSSRAAKTIEKMAGAVSAMRDIFGDIGRPNAPMIELLNGLHQLTQGGMSHMTPSQIEQSVRTTSAIARSTGLGIEGIMGFAGTAGDTLKSLGMSRALAPQIAQGSAAYGAAFGLSGQPTNFGALDKETASQLDIQLRARAAASPLSVRLASVAQFSDEFIRKDDKGNLVTGFADDTEAYALAAAIKAGESTYEWKGQIKRVSQSGESIKNILVDAGVNKNAANRAISRDAAAVEKYIERYKTGNIARGDQGEIDVKPTIATVFANAATTHLASRGLLKDNRNVSTDIGRAIFDELAAMHDSKSELLDAGREGDRNITVAKRVRARLGDKVKNISDEDLANIVQGAFATGEEAIKMMPDLGGYESLTGAFQLHGKRTERLQERIIAGSTAMANLQRTLSHLGQEKIAGRLSDYMQNVGPEGGNIREFIGSILGGVSTPETLGAAAGLMEQIGDLQSQYDTTSKDLKKDPKKLKIELDAIMDSMAAIIPDFNRALVGNLDELTPGARKVIEDYQKRQNAKGPREKLSPTREALNKAQASYRIAQEAAFAKVPAVQAAKAARDVAANRMQGINTLIRDRRNTPEINGIRSKLDATRARRAQIDKDIASVARTGDKTMLKKLREERGRLLKDESDLQNEYTVQIQDIEQTPGMDAVLKAKDAAAEDLTKAQSALDTAERSSLDTLKDPAVIKAKEALDKAKAASGIADKPDRGTGTSSTNVSSATSLSLPSLKEMKVTATNVTVAASPAAGGKDAATAKDAAAVEKDKKVSGTLTLLGLDKVFFAGLINDTADVRGA